MARTREKIYAHKILVGICEGKNERRCENVDLIHLAQNKDQWWSLVYTIMNFLGSLECWYFLRTRRTLVSQ
jgi:hypothetical protein